MSERAYRFCLLLSYDIVASDTCMIVVVVNRTAAALKTVDEMTKFNKDCKKILLFVRIAFYWKLRITLNVHKMITINNLHFHFLFIFFFSLLFDQNECINIIFMLILCIFPLLLPDDCRCAIFYDFSLLLLLVLFMDSCVRMLYVLVCFVHLKKFVCGYFCPVQWRWKQNKRCWKMPRN